MYILGRGVHRQRKRQEERRQMRYTYILKTDTRIDRDRAKTDEKYIYLEEGYTEEERKQKR